MKEFKQTDPNIFCQKLESDPFLIIEIFFTEYGFAGARQELKKWYKTVSIPAVCWDDDKSNLLFFYETLTILLEAGYLIQQGELIYQPSKMISGTTITMYQWLERNRKREIKGGDTFSEDYLTKVLSASEASNPYHYIEKILTLKNIKKIRYGLHLWIHAGLSSNRCLEEDEFKYEGKLYNTLKKIIGAFYLILTLPVPE